MKTQLMTSSCLALSLIVTACAEQGQAPDPSLKANVDEAKRDAIFKKYFPKDVRGKPHEGFAAIQCRVLITGRLSNCAIVFEDPPGAGIGAATLRVSSNFKVHPPTQEGWPVEGLVTIPLHWVLNNKKVAAPLLPEQSIDAATTPKP